MISGSASDKLRTMQFSVANSIANLESNVYNQSFPNYSSKPAIDRINPGLVTQLYTDIVPLHYAHNSPNAIHQKKEPNEDILQAQQVENQTGSGAEDIIKHSFLHPQPIQTEVLLPLKKNKRKIEEADRSEVKSTKKIKHKFQFA